MTELKAYSVAERGSDFYEIVFAADHERAKALAWGIGLYDCNPSELQVVRVPRADQFAGDTARCVDITEWERIAWALHWPMAGLIAPCCHTCGRSVFASVPESQLTYDAEGGQRCQECAAT